MEDLKKKLESEIESCDWEMLAPHYQRDVVIWLGEGVELIDAGMALAQDQVQTVANWQAEGLIGKPTEDQVKVWEQEPKKKFANFLIVQPFVLIKQD